ncbi:hypothetical protein CTAYLR_010100 [Chrysophaeum taylorii]|uniref:HSF-type DNA-binding domain-containing protein n=1 Tax=Chrysophaeum taylorii TaxID=2483200 RepID=A0AAD7XHN3_9STRA|nr:hypothetical protein CTAYLR_010100 [Chrysophaeum taylorii]
MGEQHKRKRTMENDVPVFIRTLYALLGDCDASIGRWSEDGTQIVIVDPARFAAEICPKFFRHRNFNSFTRLLNMYQFHKVQGSSSDSKLVCFAHDHFVRGCEDRLSLIQRKSSTTNERDGQPRTGVEALVARDVWEKTNKEIDQMQKRLHTENSTVVSTWMRRVLELEREVKMLREKNDALRKLDAERASLYAQLQAQNDMIATLHGEISQRRDALQHQTGSLDPVALMHLAIQMRKQADPVGDLLQQMGLDASTLLAGINAAAAPVKTPINPPEHDETPSSSFDNVDPSMDLVDFFCGSPTTTKLVDDDALFNMMSHLQHTPAAPETSAAEPLAE